MPVAPSSRNPRTMVIAVGGLVFGLALAVGIFIVALPNLEESGQVDNSLGDDVFADIRADEELAEEIAERGPLLVPDVAGGDRDVFVQHVGTDPDEGWLVFASRPTDASRDCTLVWEQEEELFRDPCGDRTFPADGAGLKQYPVTVTDDDVLEVDLNFESRPAETTSTVRVTGR